MHQLVKDTVELGLVPLKLPPEDLIGLAARFALVALKVAREHRTRHLLAAEFKFHARHELGVFADELVFLDQIGDDRLAHRFAPDLHRAEKDGRELFLQLGAEGRVKQGSGKIDGVIVKARTGLIVIFLFGDIKFVDRIDGIAHIGEASGGHIGLQQRQIVLARGKDFVGVRGLPDAAEHVLHHRGGLLDCPAFVGQFGYFHAFFFLSVSFVSLFYNIS